MADLMIEAANLRRTFKEIVAVAGISFSVQRVILGSTVVLLVVSAWVLRRQSAVAATI